MTLKILTIKKTTEFSKIKNNCQKLHSHIFILQQATTPELYIHGFKHQHICRFGITVSKVVSKSACQRNLVKRRIRSAMHQLLPSSNFLHADFVVIAKKQILEVDYNKIYHDLRFALRKIKSLTPHEVR